MQGKKAELILNLYLRRLFQDEFHENSTIRDDTSSKFPERFLVLVYQFCIKSVPVALNFR